MHRSHRAQRRAGLAVASLATLGLFGCGSSAGIKVGNDSIEVGEGGNVTTTANGAASLLANDIGVADVATVATTPAVAPEHGTIELAADGTFRYTHDGSETTADAFSYAILIGGQIVATGAVAITVVPADDPPNVVDDLFVNGVGNTYLAVGVSTGSAVSVQHVGSLLDNDSDPDGTLRVSRFDAASAQGGVVSVNQDGTFRYLPPTGFTGQDTFTYEATDGLDSRTGTVTIVVSELVWYVDGARTAAGDGSAGAPFRNFDELANATGPDVGSTIYVCFGTGHYEGPLILQQDQTVVGSGSTLTVRGQQLTAAGSAPRIESATGVGVVLMSGNTLQGFVIGDTHGPGLTSGVGDAPLAEPVKVRDVAIEGAGTAVAFTGATLDVELTSVTSANAANEGIALTDCRGTFTVLGETVITTPGSTGIAIGHGPVDVPGSDVVVTFAGPVSIVGAGYVSIYVQSNDGPISFQDVTISGRNEIGISILQTGADVTFRDVDIDNANDVDDLAVGLVEIAHTVRFASLDVEHVLQSASPTPASCAIYFGSSSSTGVLEVTANGPQLDGGTISDVAGHALLAEGFGGSLSIKGMTFTACDDDAVVLTGDYTSATLAACTFTGWDRATADKGALDVQFGATPGALVTVSGSLFDSTGVAGSGAVVTVRGGTESTSFVFGGTTPSGSPDGPNTLIELATTGLRVLPGTAVLQVDVLGTECRTSGTSVPPAIAVESAGTGTVSLGVQGATFTGEFQTAIRLQRSAPESYAYGDLLASLADNTVSGAGQVLDLTASSTYGVHVSLTGTVATGLTGRAVTASLGGTAPIGDPLQLQLAGNSYGFAVGAVPAAPAIGLTLGTQCLVRIANESVTGFESGTWPTVAVTATLGASVDASLVATDNGFGESTAGALQATLGGGSGGTLTGRITGHTAGGFDLVQAGGTFQVEEFPGFATANPGTTLSSSGTIGNAAPGTATLPEGPWR
ncbi:MAG: cadherin-like domain-containing protein [Planctomycetes bacterium]|nr:cadherin-like domain-containing protein [Planctomycetota bacterium]